MPTAHTDLVTARITIANVIAAEGKRPTRIVSTDGDYFTVWPKQNYLLSRLFPGQSYDMEYTEEDKNGYTNRTVKDAKIVGQVGPAPANFHTSEPRGQYDVVEDRKPQQQVRAAPAPTKSLAPPMKYRDPVTPGEGKAMFRTSCMTAAIESRQVLLTREAIAALIVEIDGGYDLAVGNN